MTFFKKKRKSPVDEAVELIRKKTDESNLRLERLLRELKEHEERCEDERTAIGPRRYARG